MKCSKNEVTQQCIHFEDMETAEVAAAVVENKKSIIDDLCAKAEDILHNVRSWWSKPGDTYEGIAGEKVSPMALVRINLASCMLGAMAFCAWENWQVTAISTACVGWIVYHGKTNKPQKAQKKGGK